MRFEFPDYLWLLLMAPALVVFFWWSWKARRRLTARFIQARLLPELLAGLSSTRQKIRAALLIGSVVCLVIALARPLWGYDLDEVRQRGLDIMVAIDTSKSMLAEDIAPNRLERAKLAALDLMQQAKSDRLGLIAFAGTAFLQCPLTIDDAAFRESVESLDVNTLPQGGTAIADAIETAVKSFKGEDNHRVLVLFTDGEDQDSGALAAARRAADDGLKIFTIGIGSAAGEILRVKDANGQTDYVRDEQGNVVKSHLNETLLREIATATSASYLPLRGANTMDMLYQQGLAPLPKSESRDKWVRRARERYHWPLALAICLLMSETILPERKQRRRVSRLANAPSKPALAKAALAALLMLPFAAKASTAGALRDYNAGKFVAAQKEFERLAETDKRGDARLFLNAGDAAYRATNYDAALKFFKSALASPDVELQEKVYFNLGNTQFRLGEEAKDLDGVEGMWREAMANFQSAVSLNKADADAAFNLEFVKNKVAAIEKLREAARRAKEDADEDVRQRNYHRALEIMQEQVQKNSAAKQFRDYVKRLKDIDEIATPHQP